MILYSKLKRPGGKIVTKSQVVTEVNVTKSRLHCTISTITCLGLKHAFSVDFLKSNTCFCSRLYDKFSPKSRILQKKMNLRKSRVDYIKIILFVEFQV